MSKEISAYVDRIIAENKAVVIAEDIAKEFIIDVNESTVQLKSGVWLKIIVSAQDDIQSLTIDEEKTKEKQASIHALHNKLKSKQRSKFRKR